jgi:antitoxin MazE
MTTTNIVKWGNSRGIRLSKNLLDSVNLTDNDKVDVMVENNSIIITKASTRKHRTLKERLSGHNGSYEFVECDTGMALGYEVIEDEGYNQ